MNKTLRALIAGASLMLACAAHAGVIHFDELATGDEFSSVSDLNPYAGLNWSTDWYVGNTGMDGYANGAHSGANFALNGYGDDPAGIASATAFRFAGAWFATPAGAGEKASWINIDAYDAANQLIGSTGHVAIGDDYKWVGAGFENVSYLSITRDNGWYVMDDVTVPEPGTPAVLAIGLLALGLGRGLARRRSARATRSCA